MPSLRTNSRSFTGGEVTPEFFGRIDDSKYQTGLATCRNFIVKPHGPVANRGGTQFVCEVKASANKARLFPFIAAEDESLVIEAGNLYFRFHTEGATLLLPGGITAWSNATTYAVGDLATRLGVTYYCILANTNQQPPNATYWYAVPSTAYEIPHPYAHTDLASIKFVQSNDVVTLVHPDYPPAELRRYGATRWVYSVISFVSSLAAPGSVSATATPATTSPGTPTLQSYVVTAVAGADEGPSSAQGGTSITIPAQPTGGPRITGITKANPGVIKIEDEGLTITTSSVVFIAGVGGMTQINNQFYDVDTVTPVTIGSIYLHSFVTVSQGGTPLDTSAFSAYTSGGTMGISSGGVVSTTGVGTCSNNLFDDGAYNTIAWAAVPGAQRYYVYKLSNGLFGYIGQTEGLSFVDDDIAADISKTPPILENPFVSAGNYPAAVGYYEQRRCFAGTDDDPAFFWATRSATESNLSYSIPQRDDDSVRFRIAARERCAIKHIVPLGQLVLLSESSEWRIAPADGEVLTPNVSVRPQSYIGSAEATPMIVNNNLIFAAKRGGHVRELAYNWQANGYVNGDLCLRAPHLFDEATLVDLAYTKAPVPIVWAVSSSGDLLGMTYIPDQQIGAWHHHDTKDGTFENVVAVPEGDNDVLYCIVKRATPAGDKRFIEYMLPRQSDDDDTDGFFVDCGLTYNGAPATTISGLTHLEGQVVTILADGGVMPSQTVTGGAITLTNAASVVHVGLEITADLKTLPLAFEVDGYGQGRPKNVNEVWLRFFKSRGVFAGPTFDKLTEHKPRTTENYDSPPSLITGEIRLGITPTWSDGGEVCLRHTDPLPLTLVSMTLGIAVGG